MAKAELLLIGDDAGLTSLSNPGATGRWLRTGQALRGAAVRALWFDPSDALFARVVTDEGLYRSDDGGDTWGGIVPLPAYSHVAFLSDGDLVLAGEAGVRRADGQPYGSNPPEMIRALVADRDGLVAATMTGMMVCAGPGAAWQPLDGLETVQLAARLGGPTPTTIAATPDALLRSGATGGWEPATTDMPGGAVSALCIAPYHVDVAFVGTTAGHVLRSGDRGRTWQTIRQPAQGSGSPVRALATARVV